MITSTGLLQAALELCEGGRWQDCLRQCRTILALQPAQPDAWHLSAACRAGAQEGPAAERGFRRALHCDQSRSDFWANLAAILVRSGKSSEAATIWHRHRLIDPAAATATLGLAQAKAQGGQTGQAIAFYQRALRLAPDSALGHIDLSGLLVGRSRFEAAARHARIGIVLAPEDPASYANDGYGQWAGALPAPALGQLARALRIDPALAEAHLNSGNALTDQGRAADAKRAFLTALTLRPAYADAWSNLANGEKRQGRHDLARPAYLRAISLAEDPAEAMANFSTSLTEQGLCEEAADWCDRAIAANPYYAPAYSNRIMALQYHEAATPMSLLAEGRRFAAQFEPAAPAAVTMPVTATSERRIRIGYVSGDLRHHPVGQMLLPILRHQDGTRFESYFYANQIARDQVSDAFAAIGPWRPIAGLSDDQVARQISQDGIDVLVDLSGHTARNRLPMFARRAAPIQMSWLGFWGTTGLRAIDHVITDWRSVPAGEEAFFSENVMRLARCRFCYAPPADAPPILGMDAQRAAAPPIFGSFNNLAKLSGMTLRLWSEVLRAIPEARLVIKWRDLEKEDLRRTWSQRCADAGIAADRVSFRPASAHAAMMAEYGDIDIALDSLPFNGGLTSCEALWMGVPVLTRLGSLPQSRQTATLLDSIGRPEWIARSDAEFVSLAQSLCADLPHLRSARPALRARMAASPLCDGLDAARALENCYLSALRMAP